MLSKQKTKETKSKKKEKKPKKKEEKVTIREKYLPSWGITLRYREDEKVVFLPVKPGYEIIEEYWVVEPHAKVKIVSIPHLGGQIAYFVEEVKLTEEEKKAVQKLIDILSVEMKPPPAIEEDVKGYLVREAKRLLNKYRKAFRKLKEESWNKVLYYIERDLLGYGPINVLMLDPMLEDISCDGTFRAIHVWHRKYESIPTNIIFTDIDYLREFIVKLAHIAGKHVSTAFPVVDARLPGGHRLAATYGEEVSPRGSTFTIRKFREKPFSIIELIESGTIDPRTAAYIWLLLEHRMTMMIIGGTAAGKTTLLNALLGFIKPSFKIVTIEETPEINIYHENWVQFVSREAYGLGAQKGVEIDLYELVRISLRYRPDYIIVGEVRGREAFVLFQAMATGHGGLTTFHADSLENVIRRLMSPPMNVSEPYIPMLNVVLHISRVSLPNGGFGRRVLTVWEIEDFGKYRVIVRWDPIADMHVWLEKSYLLEVISQRTGKSVEELEEEIKKRTKILLWMLHKGIRDMYDVARVITRFYRFPEELYKEAEQMDIEEYYRLRAQKVKVPVKSVKTVIGKSKLNTVKETAKVKTAPADISDINLTDEQIKVLALLYEAKKEIDYKTLARRLNMSEVDLWRHINKLNSQKLVKSTITYVENAPIIGFVITDNGRRVFEKIIKKSKRG